MGMIKSFACLFYLALQQIILQASVNAMVFRHIDDSIETSPTEIARMSTYILPDTRDIVHGIGTLYKVQGFVNITYENISNLTTCQDVRNYRLSNVMSNQQSKMATCPYFFRRNMDINRIPYIFTEAKCICRCCGMESNCSRRQPKCREIYRYAEVLRRYNDRGHYKKVIEPISIGCSCINPPPRRTMRPRINLHVHMPEN